MAYSVVLSFGGQMRATIDPYPPDVLDLRCPSIIVMHHINVENYDGHCYLVFLIVP
jgi:hypothetical protein